MLERYEKNVTVESIANCSSVPIIFPKPENGEAHGHAVKSKVKNNQESTSNKRKPSNAQEKHSRIESKPVSKKAQGKSSRGQTKRTATTKKTISLSANFSAGLRNSKRSLVDSDSTKDNDRQDNKHIDKRLDYTTESPNDSTQEFADTHGSNESNLDSKLHCDAVVLNEQITTVAIETTDDNNETDSKLEEHFDFENSYSDVVNPVHTLGNEIDLNQESDNSKKQHSVGDKLSCDVSMCDAQVKTKDAINSLFNSPDPTVQGEDSGPGHQTSPDNDEKKEIFEEITLIEEHGELKSRNEKMVETQVISDQEESEFTIKEEQHMDRYHSDNLDEESDSSYNQSINKPDEAVITSCPTIQPSLPSTGNKEDVVFRSEEQNSCDEAKKLSFNVFLPVPDLQSSITVEHDGSAEVLFDTKEHGTTFSKSNNTGDVDSETNFDLQFAINNTQRNPSSSVFDVPTKTVVDTASSAQEYDRFDLKDRYKNVVDSYTLFQSNLPDLVVNPNSEVPSNSEFDAPEHDAMYSRTKINEGNSGIDSGAFRNDTDIVRHDQEHPCENSPIATDDALQSSRTEQDQADYRDPSQVYPKSPDKDAVDVHVLNTGKENFQNIAFDLETRDSKVQSGVSELPTTAKDDALDPIKFLKDCFPNNEIDILKSFFNSCNEDLVKTVECLLECNLNDYNDTEHEHSTVESFNNDLLRSTSAENRIQDTSGNLKTPEENRNSSFNMKLESPISSSSTPRKFQNISVDSLQLTLDPALALQLLEMFGAFSGVSGKGSCFNILIVVGVYISMCIFGVVFY